MEKRTIIIGVSVLCLIAVSLLGARSGDTCVVDRLPTVEERVQEVPIVVVATVGDLADTTAHESGFFFGELGGKAHVQFIVHAILKGVAIPDTLTLPFVGLYSTFFREGSQGWSIASDCAPDISRGEVVVLFLEGVEGLKFLRGDNVFQLVRSEWDPGLLQTDIVLVRVQKALAGPPCSPGRVPTLEERARGAAIVVVARVGDLVDATADDLGFFDGTAYLQFSVQTILKGTAIPDTLTLPFEGRYTTFFRMDFWGWSIASNCAPDISRGEWVLLFLEELEGHTPLQFENIFHLGYYMWDPILLHADYVLVQVQQALAGPSSVERQGSWGALKQRFR